MCKKKKDIAVDGGVKTPTDVETWLSQKLYDQYYPTFLRLIKNAAASEIPKAFPML